MRELKPGLYGPLPTFFDDNQELDLVSYKSHLISMPRKSACTYIILILINGIPRFQIWRAKASVSP